MRCAFLILASALVLIACGGGDSAEKVRSPTPSPAPTATAVATTSGFASPTAAGIAGAPRTAAPAPSPVDSGGAEALVRRVALLSTDLPPGLTARPPLSEDIEAAARRVADPAGFRERARQWERLAAFHTGFEAASVETTRAGLQAVGSSTVRFAAEDGARAQFDAMRTGGFDAVTAAGLKTPLLADIAIAETMTRPDVGDESLAWRIAGGTGASRVPGSAVAFRRGNYVVVVLVYGEGDAASFARTLDTRARETR